MTEKVVMLAALLLLFWSVHYGATTVEHMDPALMILTSSILGCIVLSSTEDQPS